MIQEKNQETREILLYELTPRQYDFINIRMWEKETKTAENYTLIEWSGRLATSLPTALKTQYTHRKLTGRVNESC